jgi:hypothetical protein
MPPTPSPRLSGERAGVRGFEHENNRPPHPSPLLPRGRRGRKLAQCKNDKAAQFYVGQRVQPVLQRFRKSGWTELGKGWAEYPDVNIVVGGSESVMKLFTLLIFISVAAGPALGQMNFTNDVSTTAAINVVSQLKVGLQEEEARKVLATNGLPMFISFGRPGRWDDSYLLSDGQQLMLGYSSSENISNGVLWEGRLSYALIQGNVGDAAVIINLSNAPINALGVPGGVAEIYHLDVDNPSAEDRARLAGDFPKFTPENQYRVLARLWPRVRCPEFAKVLLPLAKPPKEPEREHADMLRDEVFIRLLELKPEAVRPLILEDLRRENPLFSLEVLRALPDKELPELDDVLIANLGDNQSIWKIAPLIERYASARILPQVIAFYDDKEGSWACSLQTAFLRYWLKHDKPAALQALERAVNSRSSTGCYEWVLGETLHDSFDAETEKLVLKYVNDPVPEVAADAKKLLSQHTSAAVPN